MTLHEAIQVVLEGSKQPMRARDIALEINRRNYYERKDGEPIDSTQIYIRVKNYPSIFQNVNGYILLVKDSIWKGILTSYDYLTNTLRGIFIQADVQFIIAALIYYKRTVDINDEPSNKYPLLKNDDLFDHTYSWAKGRSRFFSDLEFLEKHSLAPRGVFKECIRLLDILEDSKIQEICAVITNISTTHINDREFGSIYEYFITIIAIDNNKSSVNHTPYSLRQLMIEILNPRIGSDVYDPVAGMGGLIIEAFFHANKKLNISGSEINQRLAQLGNMNVRMHGINSIFIENENSFEQINQEKKYDYIIGDLPANGITNSWEHEMVYNKYDFVVPKSGKSFGSLILFTLDKLNNYGKAVLTVSDGFLAKKGNEQRIRQLLVDQDVIESIISLPYGTLRPYTDAKASLLILNKNKPQKLHGNIQFITAKALDQSPKSVVLNIDEIVNIYINKESFEKNAQIVSVKDLRSNFNLLGEAYDTEFLLANFMLKDGNGRSLGDLVTIKSGTTPEKSMVHRDGDIPLVKVEKLSKDILDINLNIKNGEGVDDADHFDRNTISDDCILIARIGDNLKATIFRPTDNMPKIILHTNVYGLIPTNAINIEYLYYQLHSVFIQDQIEKRKQGAVMPYVSIAGLKEIVVPYMTLEAQQEFVLSQKASLIAEERNRVEERIKGLDYKEETKQAEADVIKTLTHQLRPTFSGLNGITRRIERISNREKLGHLKEYDKIEVNVDPEIEGQIILPDNYNLSQLIEKLSMETQHLSDILTNVDKVMNFKLLREDLQETNLHGFLNEYKAQKEVERNGKYTIVVKGESISAFIHGASFKELLDQLLNNAEKHAFVDQNKNNKVQFNVRYNKTREVAIIEYSNNGKPYELSQNDFVTAFEKGNKSKGSGIGGNYISRIVSAHNGKLIVEEGLKKGFSLTIELPTSNSKIYE